MQSQSGKSLGARVYSGADQRRFAELSGDFNPVHLDPVAARREIFGDIVVHGMHGVLGAFNEYCGTLRGRGVEYLGIRKLSGRFPGPIQLGQSIGTFVSEAADDQVNEKVKLQSWHGDRPVLDLQIEWVHAANNDGAPAPVSRLAVQRHPANPSFASLAGQTGNLDLVLDYGLAEELFPHLLRMIPAVTIAELLAVTRLVGMECPGLRSVLSTVSLTQTPAGEGEAMLAYKVTKTDDRFSLVKLAVTGPSLAGSIDAFYRPAPVAQPTVAEVAARVSGSQCAPQCALIVGGSRGLGEVTAKIVAAAGGHSVITYQSGREDAGKIAAEITAAGLRAEARRMDVFAPEEAVTELYRAGIRPTHVYYFASPKIFVSKGSMFDAEVFGRFAACYVDGFYKLYRACRSHWDHRLVFFYPSSVAVDERTKDLAEYAAAKIAGETLAAHLAQFDRKLSVLIRRLPRIATDQTTTLMPFPAADALDVMLAIVRELSHDAETHAELPYTP